MKKTLCLLICFIMALSFVPSVFAEDGEPWEAEYTKLLQNIEKNSKTKIFLFDFTGDKTPDLIVGDNSRVELYSYQEQSLVKLSTVTDIPIDYFVYLKKMQQVKTKEIVFLGQLPLDARLVTYQIDFSSDPPSLTIIATENDDNTGTFYGENEGSEIVSDCGDRVYAFLSDYTTLPETACVLTPVDILSAGSVSDAAQKLFDRYLFLNSLADDISTLSTSKRNTIKELVGTGNFLSFEKITVFSGNSYFVQFYETTEESDSRILLPTKKRFSLVSESGKKLSVSVSYDSENELDVSYLSSLSTLESFVSNVSFDYAKSSSFRGIDDYVNHLSSVLSALSDAPNENGKKAITEYMEYAVAKSSRTAIKAKNNHIYLDDYSVSFIAEYAADCLERLQNVCKAKDVSLTRKARAIPELVCSKLDLSAPLRIEFQPGLSEKLCGASGIKLMLDENHGIFISAADLKTLDAQMDTFCIEFRHKQNAFSVVFTDKNNIPVSYISAPVWFIVPATSKFSTVMASFQGGTANWGGQFDTETQTIEFSTNYSGDYEIAENDITINDIDDLDSDTKEIIRFMVSKGIFSLGNNQKFYPDEPLSRYDFTVALVKMFYALNNEAESSFSDVSKDDEAYRYIASAESLGLADGFADKTFRGETPVSKEQMLTLCGRTLSEKKDYNYPKDHEQYLNFSDSTDISTWARGDIALSVQCGLIENSGTFSPQGTVSRAEGAEILYKTFMLLYDVSPISTTPSEQASAKNESAILTGLSMDLEFRVALCILLFIVTLFGAYLLVKIRRYQKNKRKTKEKEDTPKEEKSEDNDDEETQE